MKSNEIIKQLKVLLGMEIKLATMNLADGVTMIEAENWEIGNPVMIVQEGGNVPLPVGEYELEDGRTVVVTEDGVIGEVKEPMTEEEVPEEVPMQAEMSESQVQQVKKTVESIVKEQFFSEIEALKKDNEELKAQIVELSKQQEIVKLSEEPIKPIVHNPEPKDSGFLIGKGSLVEFLNSKKK